MKISKILTTTLATVIYISVMVFLSGCGGSDVANSERKYNESNQQRLAAAVPAPNFDTSLERKNLVRRYQRFNVENKISYIYLLSDTGVVVAFYPIKGKVSSVDSLLNCPEQQVWNRVDAPTLPAPQPDGSYNTNGNAIFFFTTEDVYVEWAGVYLLCDQPLALQTKPVLIRRVEDK